MQEVKKQQHSSGNGTQNVEMPTVNEMCTYCIERAQSVAWGYTVLSTPQNQN